MLKKYRQLHVLGDSYTTPDFCVNSNESFWGLAATHLGVNTVIIYSWPGNSVDSILHILASQQSNFDWAQDYFLIGVPPLERLTVFDNHKDSRYSKTVIDSGTWSKTTQDLTCHTGLMTIAGWEAQQMVVYYDRSWVETQVLTKLFYLSSWLDSKQASYLILNLSKPFDQNCKWGPSEFVLPWAESHPRMILFKDTYYSINEHVHKPVDFAKHGWWGHHGPAGNKHFFEKSIKNKLC